MKIYYPCVMSSRGGTLYTGVTNDIQRRVISHKERSTPGFTQRYNVTRLVYYEESNSIPHAIRRENRSRAGSGPRSSS